MCVYVCVCVSFMHYHTIHPIAMKIWEVVQYTPAKVSAITKFGISDFITFTEGYCKFYNHVLNVNIAYSPVVTQNRKEYTMCQF